MKLSDDKTFKVLPEANGSHQIMEMHLFDNNAGKENDLCVPDTSADDPRGVNGYRRTGCTAFRLASSAEGCKTLVVPFAEIQIRDLEADGWVD